MGRSRRPCGCASHLFRLLSSTPGPACPDSTREHGRVRVAGMIPREIGTGVTAVDESRNRLYVHGVRGLAVVDATTFARVDFLPLEAEPGGEPMEVRTFYSVDLNRKRVFAVRHIMLHSNELEIYEAPS